MLAELVGWLCLVLMPAKMKGMAEGGRDGEGENLSQQSILSKEVKLHLKVLDI